MSSATSAAATPPVSTTSATTSAPDPPPVPPPVAQTLNVFTVIDGVEHRGTLELQSPNYLQKLAQSVPSFTSEQPKIESYIKLIPDSPTLDGPIKILLAVYFINKFLKVITVDTFNKNYTQYYQYVEYTFEILKKVNKILHVIRDSNNNMPAYLKKYNEAFQKLKDLCNAILGLATVAMDIELTQNGETHPTTAATTSTPTTINQDANISRTDDLTPYNKNELRTMLEYIQTFITYLTKFTSRNNQEGGNAKTRRKRLRRRRSSCKKTL